MKIQSIKNLKYSGYVYNIETSPGHNYYTEGVLVHNCNLSCKYCYVPNKVGNELDTDSWKHILSNLAKSGIFQVSFGGGEPTMRGDLFDLASYVEYVGMNLGMTSNGILIPNMDYHKLKRFFKQINISWHSNFKVVDEALHYLEYWGIPRGINYTYSVKMSKANDMVKGLAKKYNAELLYLVYKPSAHDCDNQVAPNDVHKVAKQAASEGLRVAVDGPAVKQCLAKRKFVDVNHRGNVYQCSFVRNIMGNLLTEDFMDIWRGRGELGTCPYIDLVTGNCISHVGEEAWVGK